MPFTPSHTIAVLPLVRARVLDPTCLVIGSMAPDFEYFVRGRLGGTVGHTLIGLVVWCLPVTLIVAGLYHAVVKWPWLLIAPAYIRERAVAKVGAPWRERWTMAAVASCALSAMLGGATHIVWDSFTHKTGWGVHHVALLRAEMPVPVLGTDTVARVLQHTSSVIGLVILGFVGVRALRRQPAIELECKAIRARWIFACVIATAVVLLVVRVVSSHRSYEAGDLVVASISGMLAGSLIAGLIVSDDASALARRQVRHVV